MQAKKVLTSALAFSQNMLNSYLSDLSDDDILVRPVPAANHVAWQIGHLAASEVELLANQLPGAAYPELPPLLKEHASGKSATTLTKFLSKAEYLEWFNKIRKATIENVERLADADLDKANTGSMKDFAPTLADLINLVCVHDMMHGGQFTVTRRALGKPVLF